MVKNAVGVSEKSGLDPEQFLGRLTMFTMPDEPINGAKLVRAWNKHNLDMDDLPDQRQPVHVFQSACASVKQRRAASNGGDRTEIAADEVHNNGRGCIYQVTVRVWDLSQDVIEHEKALRVHFDKTNGVITFDRLGSTDPRLDEIEERIQSHFDANAKTIPGAKIRNAVRATIQTLGAQNLRRKAGGVYFVPTKWRIKGSKQAKLTKPTLDGLEGVLHDLYGDRADFYMVPLVNDQTQAEMVAKHFSLNVCERSQELLLKAVERVRAGTTHRGVRQELLANLYSQRRKLAGEVQQFESMVNVSREDIDANLRDLDKALEDLQELADTHTP